MADPKKQSCLSKVVQPVDITTDRSPASGDQNEPRRSWIDDRHWVGNNSMSWSARSLKKTREGGKTPQTRHKKYKNNLPERRWSAHPPTDPQAPSCGPELLFGCYTVHCACQNSTPVSILNLSVWQVISVWIWDSYVQSILVDRQLCDNKLFLFHPVSSVKIVLQEVRRMWL
jgi:hypothetical protein